MGGRASGEPGLPRPARGPERSEGRENLIRVGPAHEAARHEVWEGEAPAMSYSVPGFTTSPPAPPALTQELEGPRCGSMGTVLSCFGDSIVRERRHGRRVQRAQHEGSPKGVFA